MEEKENVTYAWGCHCAGWSMEIGPVIRRGKGGLVTGFSEMDGRGVQWAVGLLLGLAWWGPCRRKEASHASCRGVPGAVSPKRVHGENVSFEEEDMHPATGNQHAS